MPTGSRKRQRRGSSASANRQLHSQPQSQPKLITFDKDSASPPGWLPHDLIKHCLTYLNHKEVFPHRRINHAWAAAVADCVECLLYAAEGQWLDCSKEFAKGKWLPSNRKKESKQVLCSLNYMTEAFREQITEISLESPEVLQFANGHLHSCKSLQKLNVYCSLRGGTVRIHGLELIPALQEVCITALGTVDVTCLSWCRSLKKLSLLYCYFTETGIQGVETMPALERLNLEGSHFSHKVSCLARCRSLKILSLTRCPDLKNVSIVELELIPTLEELDLSQTKLTDVTVLAKCKALKKLSLKCCYELTDAGIQGLERIPTLEELHLDWVFGITSVSHLSACRSLKNLLLPGCSKISDPGIQGLELIPTLQVLDLGWTGITSVSHLAACKALKKLDLVRCKQLTDAGIEGLEVIPTLEELDLTQTNVTNSSRFAACKSLKSFRFGEDH